MNELQLLLGKNSDFFLSSVLCFTETWLCGSIPESELQLAGFQLLRAAHDTELSGKSKSGGICFYINSSWCNDVTVSQQHYSSMLEYFIINCKPFYSPHEFHLINFGRCLHSTAGQRACSPIRYCVEQTNLDSLVIVLGDFNKGNLSHKLPLYKQFIKCPTREKNILDTVSRAYHAVPRAALGLSDHAMVHLIPSYRQKLKLCKPVAGH